MAVATFSQTGAKSAGSFSLPKSIFAEDVKDHILIKQAIVTQHASNRANTAASLGRGQVRGGGIKPWRQKGLGRARHGSIRSPIWRGGGVTFGPTTERNYSMKLNKSAKKKSLRQALTLLANNGSLSIIEDIAIKEAKTKAAASFITKLNLPSPLLLVVDNKTDQLEMSTRNISGLKVVSSKYLSVFQIVCHRHVLMTKPAVEELEGRLANTGSSKQPARTRSKK